MNVLSNRKYITIFLIASSGPVTAEEIEKLQILAPKKTLSVNTVDSVKSHVNDGYNFTLDRSIADQLKTIPGVDLTGQGGQFQSYAIRGFSRARIRTEVDGIPIITDRRAGNSISFLSPNLFSTASVIKGPSSTIYGSQAMGGVVSLTTNMLEETKLELVRGIKSNSSRVTFKHKNKGVATALAYQHENNVSAVNNIELNNQFERVSGVVRYQHIFDNITTTISWLPSYGKDIGKSNNKYPLLEVSEYPQEVHSLTQVQFSSSDQWLLKLFHHYQNWDSETIRLGQYTSLTEYQSHTTGSQWLYKFDNNADSHIGIDWLARKGVSINNGYIPLVNTIDALDNDLEGNEDNLAVFHQNRWQLAKATLNFSWRYDWLKQRSKQRTITDNKLNAALSLNYAITNNSSVSLEVANGFRYPTLSERFFSGRTPRGFVAGNELLESESSIGNQLIIDWGNEADIRLKSSFYHYKLDNYIERYRVNEELLSYRNLTSANIKGFELEADWYVSEQVEHHFSYQYQKGTDAQNEVLADLHPKEIRWSTFIYHDDLTLSNEFIYSFNIASVADSETPRDSYFLWNLSFDFQLSTKQDIQLKINNVNNEAYFASLDEDAALQPERNISLSTTWRF